MKNMDYNGKKKKKMKNKKSQIILLRDIPDREHAEWLRNMLKREHNLVTSINSIPGKGFYLIYRYGGKSRHQIFQRFLGVK